MPKKLRLVIGICVVLLIVGSIVFYAFRVYQDSLVVFPADGAVVIRCQQPGIAASRFPQTLSEENAGKVKDILSRCRYDGAAASGCYFDENCSITVGNTVFLLSQDGCPTVRNPQANRYFRLNAADWRVITQIFAEYGGRI